MILCTIKVPVIDANSEFNYVINLITTSRNKGSVPQSLISCRLAGWVQDKQFSFRISQKYWNSPAANLSSSPINQESVAKAAVNPCGATSESLTNTSIMKNGVISGTVKHRLHRRPILLFEKACQC